VVLDASADGAGLDPHIEPGGGRDTPRTLKDTILLIMSLKTQYHHLRRRVYYLIADLGLYRYNLDVYNHNFFLGNRRDGEKHAQWFVDLLIRTFGCTSLADVGCGTGHFLKTAKDRGLRIFGIEGAKEALGDLLMVDKSCVCQHDLRDPIAFSEPKYDLCISVEVAEHIDRRYSDNFIKILTDLSDTVALTAAHPNQGGAAHVNEQPQEWWIDRFAKFGYEISPGKVKELRNGMEEAKAKGFFVDFYLIPNIMVFENKRRTLEQSAR